MSENCWDINEEDMGMQRITITKNEMKMPPVYSLWSQPFYASKSFFQQCYLIILMFLKFFNFQFVLPSYSFHEQQEAKLEDL